MAQGSKFPRILRGWPAAGLILLLGYAAFIGMNFAPVAAGADSGGYLNSARLLAAGRLTSQLRTVPEFKPATFWPYLPLGYIGEDGSNVIKPTYPIGLPLHYALAGLLAGWHWGPLLVGVAAAVAAVVLCYLCLREFEVPAGLAALGAATLAISPMFVYVSFLPMSDTIATAWCTAAVFAALRARRDARWSVACGAALAVAVLVRPGDVLLLPALLLILRGWRALAGAFVGGLPGAVVLGAYHRAMYGSALRSGYGPIFEAFGRQWFAPSMRNYGATLPFVLPLCLLVPFALAILPWRRIGRELAACIVWFAAFALFYAFYDITPLVWWYLRFILPAFPALIILAVTGLAALLDRVAPSRRRLAGLAVASLVLLASLDTARHWFGERHIMLLKAYQQPYQVVPAWARAHLPANALIACMQESSAFYFYTDFPILRWDQIPPADFTRLDAALRASGRPFYAVLFPFESDDALHRRMPASWSKVAEVEGIGIWKYAPKS